jgi:hypothetical protein
MAEVVKELSVIPGMSVTTDDPDMPQKLANEPPLSVSSETAPAGEIAPAGETPESIAAKEAEDAAAKEAAEKAEKEETEHKEAKPDLTPPWMKALISKEKAAAAEARKESAETKKQMAQLMETMQKLAPPKPIVPTAPEPKRPVQAQFDDPQAYTEALANYAEEKAEWVAEQKTEAKLTEYRNQQQQKEQTEQLQRAEIERQAFLDKGRNKYDDFAEKCETDSLPITPIMFEAAKESEVGEDIVYYLGENPNEARRIASLKPVAQALAIAKLEAKLTAPAPVKPVTTAPKPIKPVGSSNQVAKTPEQESTEEYVTRRRREEAAKRGITLS